VTLRAGQGIRGVNVEDMIRHGRRVGQGRPWVGQRKESKRPANNANKVGKTNEEFPSEAKTRRATGHAKSQPQFGKLGGGTMSCGGEGAAYANTGTRRGLSS